MPENAESAGEAMTEKRHMDTVSSKSRKWVVEYYSENWQKWNPLQYSSTLQEAQADIAHRLSTNLKFRIVEVTTTEERRVVGEEEK